MGTGEGQSEFKIPSFARAEAYNFEATKDSFDVYRELTQISEEIERCRARNI